MMRFELVIWAFRCTEGAFGRGLLTSAFRQINDCAYFVLLFAQFEDEVNRLCGDLVRVRQTTGDWNERRAWQIIDAGRIQSLPFLSRVALLTEKGGNAFNRVRELYAIRNEIMHSGTTERQLEIERFAGELTDIARALQEAP